MPRGVSTSPARAEISQMLFACRVLTDVCCLGETLSQLIEPHARHAVSMLQDFVLAYSTVGSAITAAHIASATRQPSGSTDSESAASARCVVNTSFVDPMAQEARLHHKHVWQVMRLLRLTFLYVSPQARAPLACTACPLCCRLMQAHGSCRSQRMAELEWEDSPQPRPAGLPQQVRDMSSEAIARLHSRGAPPPAQAGAAGAAPERPKTPVQYVRSPAGPSPPLPNPFAGFVESTRAAAPEPESSSVSAGVRQVELDLPQQGRPPVVPQPSAVRRQKAAKKPAAWEMLVDPGDEPREPRKPSKPAQAERSAPHEAPLPKMAMRFQMLIDSQKMEDERQNSTSSGGQASHSAAAYPAGSSRQASQPQQGHQSMPHLRRPLPAGQPGHGQMIQKQERRGLLLGAHDSPSASRADQGLHEESSSQGHTEQQPGGLAAGEAGSAPAGHSQPVASPSAAAQLEAIARWERMLDRGASQSQAAPAFEGAHSIPQAPAPHHSAAAPAAAPSSKPSPSLEKPFPSQSLQGAPAIGLAQGKAAAAHSSTLAPALQASSFQAAQGSPPIVDAQRSAVSSSGSAAAHSSTDVRGPQPIPNQPLQQLPPSLAGVTPPHSQADEGVLQRAGRASSSSSSSRMPQDHDREASEGGQMAESSTVPLDSATKGSGEAGWPSGLGDNSEEVGALPPRFLLHDAAIQTHPLLDSCICPQPRNCQERLPCKAVWRSILRRFASLPCASCRLC